jgi:VWFA-related protein
MSPALAAPGLLFGQFKPLNPLPDQEGPLPQPGQPAPRRKTEPVADQTLDKSGDKATFSTDVKLVQLFASVRDAKGNIIKDLEKQDFILKQDGQTRTIQYFSRESDLPLTLGLLVDTSGSQRRVLEDERSASYKFLEQVLREDRDKAFVIHFDREVELLQDLTSSRPKLEEALNLLTVDTRQAGQNGGGGGYPGGGGGYPGGGTGWPGSAGGGGWPGGGGGHRGGGYPGGQQSGHRGGGTSMYDAILLAADDVLHKPKGRKAMILLTDGVDNNSKVTLADSIEAAQKSDTLVYSILFSDASAYGGGMSQIPMGGRHGGMGGGRYPGSGGSAEDGKRVLQRLSKETGGGFFEVSKKHPLDETFARIQEELRSQYSLAFSPDAGDSSTYHRVELTTVKSDLKVQTREGYYSAT